MKNNKPPELDLDLDVQLTQDPTVDPIVFVAIAVVFLLLWG